MRLLRYLAAAGLTVALMGTSVGTQQPAVTIDDDDITIRGCVAPAAFHGAVAPSMLVWSRGDMMLAGATALSPVVPNPVSPAGVAGRVFYYIDHEEDVAKHIGQLVELKGELEDFERGEMEFKPDGEFTDIELDLDGREDKIRVPSSWLGSAASSEDREFDIVTRKIEIEDVNVLGACPVR